MKNTIVDSMTILREKTKLAVRKKIFSYINIQVIYL